jgi:VWFA-related protein
MKKLLACAGVFLMAVTLSGQSQTQTAGTQNPPQGPTFRTGVDVIAVDVSVVDNRGRPVDNLLAPDFEVKIDGQVRRVVSVEQVKIDVAAAKKAEADKFESLYTTNLVPTNGRQIVIAVDQLGIRTGAVRPLLNTAGKFLDSLSPADRVAFVAYPEPGVWIDFTNDKLRLRQAMQRVVGSQSTYSGKFNIGLYEAIQITERNDERVFDLVIKRECRRLTGFALEQCERDVLVEASQMTSSVRQDTKASLRGLFDLLRYLALLEGPKSLIMMSEGMVVQDPSELDDVIRAAAMARVSVNVLLMDVPRGDVMQQQLPPSATEDRDMQMSGLENLASGARGSLYNVVGTGENIFERLSSELSAYYLVGVEQAANDRDDKNHRIDVKVGRQNVTVRSRRAFVLSSPASRAKRSPEEVLVDTLRSPFGVAELPLRLATFTRQDPGSGKVRILIAADVGQPGPERETYTLGYAFIDKDGKAAAGNVEKRTLAAPEGMTTSAPVYLTEAIVEPGTYSLRFGAIDDEGRRGGVVREVNAWKLAGEEFAMGDLMIGDLPTSGNGPPTVRPGVEPRVRDNVAAFFELYSSSASGLGNTTVNVEIADDQDSAALTTVPAQMINAQDPTGRVAQAVLQTSLLPPGRYMARARITRGGATAGVLVRPFILDPPPADAEPPRFAMTAFPKFNHGSVLQPAVLTQMLDTVEKNSPVLKDAMVEARAGRYGTAAIEALTAGDQTAAAFLKGLDWYTKGQLNEAATQLALAAGPRREFFPAAFYLGATFAAGGKDREAAGIWQLAFGKEARPSLAYQVFADARLRDGQPDSVVDVLAPAHQRNPMDDEIAMRLAMAYLVTARYNEVRAVLDRYLTRHPTDQDALFAAIYSNYQVVTREKLALSAADRTKLARYVKAYQGPRQALLLKYLDVMRAR